MFQMLSFYGVLLFVKEKNVFWWLFFDGIQRGLDWENQNRLDVLLTKRLGSLGIMGEWSVEGHPETPWTLTTLSYSGA